MSSFPPFSSFSTTCFHFLHSVPIHHVSSLHSFSSLSTPLVSSFHSFSSLSTPLVSSFQSFSSLSTTYLHFIHSVPYPPNVFISLIKFPFHHVSSFPSFSSLSTPCLHFIHSMPPFPICLLRCRHVSPAGYSVMLPPPLFIPHLPPPFHPPYHKRLKQQKDYKCADRWCPHDS